MKIGIVCYPTFGGSGVVATELGKTLSERGHTIHFITYDRPFRLSAFAENTFFHQVSPQTYPLFDFLPYESALISKMVDVARYEELDLLHVHYAIPHASSAYMARQILAGYGIHLPFITTLHGTDITLVGRETAYKPVVCFSINQSDGITSVSNYLREATYDSFTMVDKPIEVIPNFVDISRYDHRSPNGLRQRMAPGQEKVLIHISNFRAVKRVKDVYQIFCRVRERIPAKLILVGDGPERSELVNHVRENDLAADVMFLGKQEMIEHILSMADLFLMPSETESFGLAALEAMAAGLPVIATQTGGVPELIRKGEGGYLSEVGDVDDMATNALHILEDDNELQRQSALARARAEQFDIQKIVPLYEAYYERVLATVPTGNA